MASPASKVVGERRQTINTFKAIAKLRPPADQDYSVVAYALIDDPNKEKIALYIPLGNYPTKERAIERVNFIIENTRHKSVFVMKTCKWAELSTEFRPDRVETVPVDMDGKLINLHTEQMEKDKQEYERRRLAEEEMVREQDAKNDPSTIDHYIHNWFVAIKNRGTYLEYENQAKTAKENYQRRVDAIRAQFQRQPAFDSEWLAEVKRRLTNRNELHIYNILESVSRDIHDEILGPTPAIVTNGTIELDLGPGSPVDTVNDGLDADTTGKVETRPDVTPDVTLNVTPDGTTKVTPDVTSVPTESIPPVLPDVKVPNSQPPDVKGPNSQPPDVKGPNSQSPDVKGPNSQSPDVKGPNSQPPDVKVPNSQSPEVAGDTGVPTGESKNKKRKNRRKGLVGTSAALADTPASGETVLSAQE